MSRGNSGRAGGVYDDWNAIGYKPNTANSQESAIEFMYIKLLTDLAASRFKWEGMPEEIDVRYLELTLFYQALSVFYRDGRYDKYLCLRANTNGYLDYQNNPTAFNVVGNNFVGTTISASKDGEYVIENNAGKVSVTMGMGIPIWANKMRRPDIDIVRIYARKLANFDRTIEINSMNARRPKLIASTENTRLSMSNIGRQIEEGQNNIQVNGALDLEGIKTLDLGIDPMTILNLDIVRDRQWNKCMTLLGIDSANQDKKERLVSDEVSANNEQSSMMRYVNLNERIAAADRINKHYGTNIKVSYYTDEEREDLNLPSTNLPDNDDEEDDSNE